MSFFEIKGIEVIKTIPSLFSSIEFLIIQVSPPLTIKIPSHLLPVITFSIIEVLYDSSPPRAILDFKLSEIKFFSIVELAVCTIRIP